MIYEVQLRRRRQELLMLPAGRPSGLLIQQDICIKRPPRLIYQKERERKWPLVFVQSQQGPGGGHRKPL